MRQTFVVERADQRAMKHSYYLAAVVAVVACVRAFVLGGLLGAKSDATATPPSPPPPVVSQPSASTRHRIFLRPDPIRCLDTVASGSLALEVAEWGCFSFAENQIEPASSIETRAHPTASTNHVKATLRWQCDNGPAQQLELSEETCMRSSNQRVAGLRALIHAHLGQ